MIASGIFNAYYIDNNVVPGKTYGYSVSGSSIVWTEPIPESAKSVPVNVTTRTNAPSLASPGVVSVTGIVPNDDSVIVSFAPVPGAVDYRVYDIDKPGRWMKYSAGTLSVEVNGLNPAAATRLVVEALDKLGPFHKMDGEIGPGTTMGDGTMVVHINGQGDPTNVPNVIAKSDIVTVRCTPVTLTGSQVFFDTFRDSTPFKQVPVAETIASLYGSDLGSNPNNLMIREYQNSKWIVRNYAGDQNMSRIFVMSNHFMDTLYDGGTALLSWPLHNNNATLTMQPKSEADISGGKVLHITMEVDGHFNSRRWCDIGVFPSGDLLLNPAIQKLEGNASISQSGHGLVWEIAFGVMSLAEFVGTGNGTGTRHDAISHSYPGDHWGSADRNWPWADGFLPNGSIKDLDKRNKFDFYISQNRIRLLENGRVLKDTVLPVPLPFTKMSVYYAHHVYHTGNDRPDLITWSPADSYWYNFRPWADERHWDNMGFEVIDAFPSAS